MGGVGRYAAELVAALSIEMADGDLPAELVLLTNRPKAMREVLPASTAPLSGVFRRPTLVWLQLQVPRLIASSGAQLAHFTTGRAPWRSAVPFVLTVHDLTALTHPHLYPRRERWLVAPWLARSIRDAAAIIAVSEHTAASIVDRFPAVAAGVRVIPEAPPAVLGRQVDPGVVEDMRRALIGEERWAREAVLGERTLNTIWCCVASFTTRKGVAELVRAAARARTVLAGRGIEPLLVLAGAGGDDRALRALVAEHGLTDHTRVLGYVSDGALPCLYAAADLIVVPSLHEGFGLVALEGMAAGRPVVLSAAGALAEVAGGAAELVPAGDADALAEVLVWLAQSPGRRAELSELGLARAAAFSWRRAAAATLEVYDAVRKA